MSLLRPIRKTINKIKQRFVNKRYDIWCFAPFGNDFSGNLKAVFEMACEKNIKIVILTKSENFNKYKNKDKIFIINSINSRLFFKSSVIICDQMLSIYGFFKYIDLTLKPIVNVWHGIPMKNMFKTAKKECNPFLSKEINQFNIIASSKLDAKSMEMCFGVPSEKVHITGLPRIDFLVKNKPSMKEEHKKIKSLVKDKKIILFAPTWRDNPNDYYQFTSNEINAFSDFLEKNNYVLGVREHFHHKNNSYLTQLKSIGAIDLNNYEFNNIEVLLKESSLLITDYSSCYFDFLFLQKPAICFAFDFSKYNSVERGFLYDIKDVFENKVCFNFTEVINEANKLINNKSIEHNKDIFNRFYDFNDDKNTERVFELIISLIQKNN